MRAAGRAGAAGLVLICGLAPFNAAAGPWTPDPGGGYAKFGATWLPGIGFFGGPEGGELAAPVLYGPYHELAAHTWIELGLAPRLAGVLAWSPLRAFLLDDSIDGFSAHASVGEPGFGLRGQLVQAGPFALSLEGLVRAPTSSNAEVARVHAATGERELAGGLRIATGVWEGSGGVSAGVGLPALYATASVGATGRGGGWDSVLTWTAEVGTDLGKGKLTHGRVRIAGFHPLGDGSAPYHRSPSGIGNGTGYVAFTLELEREIGRGWALGGSLAGGLGPVTRQTGGPVLGIALSHAWSGPGGSR
jgi:hypothetical protein